MGAGISGYWDWWVLGSIGTGTCGYWDQWDCWVPGPVCPGTCRYWDQWYRDQCALRAVGIGVSGYQNWCALGPNGYRDQWVLGPVGLVGTGTAGYPDWCALGAAGMTSTPPPDHPPLLQVLQYNAPGGKCNRGLTVVAAYRELSGPGQKDAESLRCALAVGWCIELVSVQPRAAGWGCSGVHPPPPPLLWKTPPPPNAPLSVPGLLPGG